MGSSSSEQQVGKSTSVWETFLTKKEADEDTPSRRDGISKEQEEHHRSFYVKLITNICSQFNTVPEVPVLASLYCHRFYAARSIVHNDRLAVVTAAIFLAFKVADLMHPFRMVMEMSYSQYKHIPREDAAKILKNNEEYYAALKKKVLMAERSLMYIIGFNFKPEFPGRYFFAKIKSLTHLSDQERHTLKQLCVNFANDMLRETTMFLQYTAKELGYAFLYLTLKYASLSALPESADKSGGKEWYEADGITVERMTEVTNSILDSMEEQANKQAKIDKKRKQQAAAASKPSSAAADADGNVAKKRPAPAKDG